MSFQYRQLEDDHGIGPSHMREIGRLVRLSIAMAMRSGAIEGIGWLRVEVGGTHLSVTITPQPGADLSAAVCLVDARILRVVHGLPVTWDLRVAGTA